MSDSISELPQLEEFSLAPSIFLHFPSFNPQNSQELATQDLNKQPLLKLQKIISSLESQQDAVRSNMVLFVQRRAARLRELAWREISVLERQDQLQDRNGNEEVGKEEGYEALRIRYEKEMNEKEKENELDKLFKAITTRAKADCKSSDFEWDFFPKLTLATNLPPPPTVNTNTNTNTPNPTISPSPAPSSSSHTFNINDPLLLFTTTTTTASPLLTPISSTTTSGIPPHKHANGDVEMTGLSPQQTTSTQIFLLPKKRTADEIMATLSINLRILVDRASSEIGMYDGHAEKVVGVYKAALERRRVRDGVGGGQATTMSTLLGSGRSSVSGSPVKVFRFAYVVDSTPISTLSCKGEGGAVGKNGGSEFAVENSVAVSTGMPICLSPRKGGRAEKEIEESDLTGNNTNAVGEEIRRTSTRHPVSFPIGTGAKPKWRPTKVISSVKELTKEDFTGNTRIRWSKAATTDKNWKGRGD